jgi:hypothetical protein
MNGNRWRDRPDSDDQDRPDEPFPWRDSDSPGALIHEQIMRRQWPVSVPMDLEIGVDGARIYVREPEPGQTEPGPNAHIIRLVLQLDRARIRRCILEKMQEGGDEFVLSDLVMLARVDPDCFLEKAAAYFVDLLAKSPTPPWRDPYLPAWLEDLHVWDATLLGQLIEAVQSTNRAAGRRLRDIILDCVGDPQAREQLGWLVAAAITDQLHEL